MKKIFVLMVWAAVGGFFLPAAKASEPIKIGSVDMQRALNFSSAGQEAKKMITAEVEKMEKSFAGKQKELEKLKEDLEKRGLVMSENVRKEKERDYQTKLRDLQRLQRDYEDELRRKDRELTEKILKELAEIVRKLGESGKYTVIIEKSQPAIIYVSNSLDLTEEVIKIMNEKKK
jgi:outer membrane protein